MISVVITKHNNEYKKIVLDGHALYDDPGFDIVCASVSVLAINTFNSIERFTEDEIVIESKENGFMSLELIDSISNNTILLLNSLMLGLVEIQKQYGDEYISITYKEV